MSSLLCGEYLTCFGEETIGRLVLVLRRIGGWLAVGEVLFGVAELLERLAKVGPMPNFDIVFKMPFLGFGSVGGFCCWEVGVCCESIEVRELD